MAFAITGRFYHVSKRPARARNHSELTIGRNCSSPVDPITDRRAHLLSNAVMAAIPNELRLSPERCRKPAGNEFAIGPGPAHAAIMSTQILLPGKGIR